MAFRVLMLRVLRGKFVHQGQSVDMVQNYAFTWSTGLTLV
jgi:hypothetical protein